MNQIEKIEREKLKEKASQKWIKSFTIAWNEEKNKRTKIRFKYLKKDLIKGGQEYFDFFIYAIRKTIFNKRKLTSARQRSLTQKYEEFISKMTKWWESEGKFEKIEEISPKKPKSKKSVRKTRKKPNLSQIETIQDKNPKILQFDRNLFDKNYIRISTKNKVPQLKGWTDPKFQEERTIDQLLEKNGEYGLRTGKKLGIGDYYFIVVIFQKKPLRLTWHDWIPLSLTPFANYSYVETEKTYHFYILINELPQNCNLSRNGADKSLGIIFSEGKQVVSEGSSIDGFVYCLIKKEQDFAVYETVKQLEDDLAQKGIYLSSSKEIVHREYKVLPSQNHQQFAFVDEPELNEQQKLVKQLVLEGKNIFLTGSAGTGKSFVLRYIIRVLQAKYGGERVGITAMTGTGANIIQGNTFHSCLGIGVMGEFDQEVIMTTIMRSYRGRSNWNNLKALIVDEVSMLDGELFDKLEAIAREIRRNDRPFGGIQLILIGDFCQLPPAGRTVSKYAFEAQSWNRCIEETINLKQVYRQKKDWFISYLQAIRFGRLSKKWWENMLNWCGKEPDWPQDGIKPTALFSTNKEVADVNEKELARLPERSVFFLAEDEEKVSSKLSSLVKSCLAREKLELKVGAQVMLIRNWDEEGLVNGDKGIVVRFSAGNSCPIVRFTNGRELVVEKKKWEKIEGYDANNKPIVSAIRKQIPLILAWAITIDKSQGQSIERLIVDLKKCWRGGQVYTALSRATEPKYLQILNFAHNRLWCDRKVKEFYAKLEGREIPPPKEQEISWAKEYLQTKIRNKWKEFVKVYETGSEWPYKEIKAWLDKQEEEYFPIFLKTIEKSITNHTNLPIYRKLIQYLKKWRKVAENKEIGEENIENDQKESNLLIELENYGKFHYSEKKKDKVIKNIKIILKKQSSEYFSNFSRIVEKLINLKKEEHKSHLVPEYEKLLYLLLGWWTSLKPPKLAKKKKTAINNLGSDFSEQEKILEELQKKLGEKAN